MNGNGIMNKLQSRKFWIFIIATVLLIFGKISDSTWLYIALAFIGVEGFIDIKRAA